MYVEDWISIFLLAAACNLDTLILAFSCALRGTVISFPAALAVGGITSAVTWLSLAAGRLAAGLFPGAASGLGGAVLILMGLWTVFDGLTPQKGAQTPCGSCVPLAAALAVNNAGVGVAAGVSGLHPVTGALANLLVTLAFLWAGRALAEFLSGKQLERYAVPLSGVLLVVLGVLQLGG